MKNLGAAALLLAAAFGLAGCTAPTVSPTADPLTVARTMCLVITGENYPDGVPVTWTDELVTPDEACQVWQENIGEEGFTENWNDPDFRARQIAG